MLPCILCTWAQVYRWLQPTNPYCREFLRFSTNPILFLAACSDPVLDYHKHHQRCWLQHALKTWTKNVNSSLVFYLLFKLSKSAVITLHHVSSVILCAPSTSLTAVQMSIEGTSGFKCSHTNCRMSIIRVSVVSLRAQSLCLNQVWAVKITKEHKRIKFSPMSRCMLREKLWELSGDTKNDLCKHLLLFAVFHTVCCWCFQFSVGYLKSMQFHFGSKLSFEQSVNMGLFFPIVLLWAAWTCWVV